MRSLPSAALFLFATTLCAQAGSLHFSNPFAPSRLSNPYEPYNRRASIETADNEALAQQQSYGKRPDGIAAFANRIGVSESGLNLYQLTNGKGTTSESRFSFGLGGKGVQMRVTW